MGYREDLEAALARATALEAALRAAQGDGPARRVAQLTAELAAANAQVGALEEELARTGRELHELEQQRRRALRDEAKRTQRDPDTAARALRSLFDHNRGAAPLPGRGAGVLCPQCLAVAGERVELKRGRQTQRMGPEQLQEVWCPRCAHRGFKREGPG